MLTAPVIVIASFAYVGLLFAIAYYGDKRADAGRSIIANPYIYALSLAVYCTSWTFYGSVGRAATSGIGFLPIYLGPTLMAALWWYVMLKIIRISKQNRITSIADFIGSRYGKSQMLGGLVTIIAVVGIIPYIALQLKAISSTFLIVLQYPALATPENQSAPLFLGDNTFYIAMLLAAFTILFGTRHLDATERHEGLVAAIAFESLVKLLAFIAVGLFVTFWLYDGFGDIFGRAGQAPQLRDLGLAHLSLDGRHHVPAAPVPGDGRGERRRASPDQGDLAVPALPSRDQYLRAADHFRRAAAFSGWHSGRRHLRADAPDRGAAAVARAVRLHRRAFGCDRHGDRRNHRALHHGVQRPGDAGAAAFEGASPDRAARSLRAAAGHPSRGD